MFYPQDLIDEVRNSNDIVDVISSYLPLKQKGGSYFGICPFHSENSPSFSVRGDEQYFNCFGCGAGGNVITFIMQIDNCNFVEAIKFLAQRANITLPETYDDPAKKEHTAFLNKLFEIQSVAGFFYYKMLNSDLGIDARAYLENRGVSVDIQKKFGLGYASSSYMLYNYLKKKGYTDDEILAAGLISKNKQNTGYYDKFFKRLMFPILNENGKVVGFGGRAIEDGASPKYLNSPETPIYIKSKNLFGLSFAKKNRPSNFIIVEGYMDMISLYQYGITNVVAALGTALNKEHARAIRRHVSSVILLFDSDDAGTTAALRAIPVLTEANIKVSVLQVPNGKDPDEYVKQNGKDDLLNLLENAQNYVSFQVDCIKKSINIENINEKIFFITEVAKILSKIESAIERDIYAKEVVSYADISLDALNLEIDKIRTSNHNNFLRKSEIKKIEEYKNLATTKISKGVFNAQQQLLNVCYLNLKIYLIVKNHISPDEFANDCYKKLATIIFNLNDNNLKISPANVISQFQTVEDQKIVTEVFSKNIALDSMIDLEKFINEGIKLIKKAKIEEDLTKIKDSSEIDLLANKLKDLNSLHIIVAKN